MVIILKHFLDAVFSICEYKCKVAKDKEYNTFISINYKKTLHLAFKY